ncbi:MAG: response regulator transcription factor [Dehalococcoidaceae bacterium]|nr:response regulator transcription factor [Dehalococcoidaceae bacterium]
MPGKKVLLAEDDASLSEVIKYNLVKNGYDVITAADGIRALEAARSERPDLLVLDLMLPGMDGMEVCRILRSETSIPIIMLTARDDEVDKVLGLEIGADDYITKPFSMRELLARIKAVLRRRVSSAGAYTVEASSAGEFITSSGIQIDTNRHRVSCDGQILELGPKEFDLLALLVSNPGRVFSRDYLLQRIWGYDYAGNTRTVDVHIRWLREKIENNPAEPSRIITVRGVGYKFEAGRFV